MAPTRQPQQFTPRRRRRRAASSPRAGLWRAMLREWARYILAILATLGLMALLGLLAGLFVTVPPG